MDAPVTKDTAPSKGGKTKLVIGGVIVALLLAGIGIGVGIGVKHHNDDKDKKNSKSAAAAKSPPSPSSTTNTTGNGTAAETKSYRPVPTAGPGQNQTTVLLDIGTNTSTTTAQAYEDAEVLTVELVNEFVDFFLELADAAGLDNQTLKVLKDNRYLLVRYIRARRVDTVVKVMKELAEAPDNPPDAFVERIVNETVSVFEDGDFERWLAAGAKDQTKLTPAQVKALNDLEDELAADPGEDTPEAYPDDPVAQLAYYKGRLDDYGIPLGSDTAPGRRLAAPARRRHRLFDFEYGTGGQWPQLVAAAAERLDRRQAAGGRKMQVDESSVKRNLGLASFKRAKIGIVFHALQFVDSKDYLYPITAYQDGPALAKQMVDKVNGMYELSGMNLQFYVKEFRYDVDTYPYLLLGNRDTWQKCAADAELCTCKLAANNYQPTKYINIYLAGSSVYPGLTQLTVGYTSTLPYVQDMCSSAEGWVQAAAAKTQHLWVIYDAFDIKSTMLDNAYSEGAATLAHELGHFLGLLHTHEGDCVSGDYVPDTPSNLVVQDQPWANDLYKWCANWLAGKKPLAAGLKKFDSCRGDRYVDNVFNIMSYTPAPCNLFFTVGQVRRLQTITSRVYPAMLTPV